MCYLFLHEFDELRDIDVSRQAIDILDTVMPASAVIDREPAKAGSKRSAESDLQCDSNKKAKHSEAQFGDTEVIIVQESDDATSGSDEDIEIDDLKKQLAEARSRIAKINTANEKLETKNLLLTKEICDLQVEGKHWEQRLKEEVTRAKAYKVESYKEFKDRIRSESTKELKAKQATWKPRLDAQKKKFEAGLQAKQDRLDTEVEKNRDITDKNKDLEKELKRIKVDHVKALKDTKEEHEQALKESRKEQRDRIREWKPEHSTAIKEKDRLLKEQQKEIDSLTSIQKGLQHATDQLDTHAKELQAKHDELKLLVTERDEKLKEAAKLLRSRECAWQVQNETANKYAEDLIQQQRVNSILRSGLDRSTQRAEDLEVELLAAKDQIK